MVISMARGLEGGGKAGGSDDSGHGDVMESKLGLPDLNGEAEMKKRCSDA